MNWLRALSNVVLIAGLVYGVFVLQYMPGRAVFPIGPFGGALTAYTDSKPHDAGVTSGRAAIKVGATGLDLTSGDVLATISGQAPSADAPKLTSSLAGGVAEVTVAGPSDRTVFVGGSDSSLDMTLDRTVRWSEIRLDVGAVSGRADLRELKVERVVINAGASDLSITVGSLLDAVDIEVSGGAMSLTIRVPATAACSVHATSGVTDVRVPASFRRTEGIPIIGETAFVSDGTGGPTIKIRLTSGVSDIRIETY